MSETRRLFMVVLGPILILAALALVMERNGTVEQRIPWQTDVAAAQTQATTAGKPMMLYFTADWCGPCQQMKKSTWVEDKVVAAAEGVVPVMIDIDEQPGEGLRRGIESIPTVVLVDAGGNELARRVGFLEGDELSALLAQHAGSE